MYKYIQYITFFGGENTHAPGKPWFYQQHFFCQIWILGSRTGSKFCSSSAMLLFNKVPEIAVPPGLAVMRSALEVFPKKMLSHAGKRYCWWKKSQPANQLRGRFIMFNHVWIHSLQGLIHPRCCRMSSIDSRTDWNFEKSIGERHLYNILY